MYLGTILFLVPCFFFYDWFVLLIMVIKGTGAEKKEYIVTYLF